MAQVNDPPDLHATSLLRHPDTQDWDRIRPRVVELCRDCSYGVAARKLREEYGYLVTPRMVRHNAKKFGIRKNCTEAEVKASLRVIRTARKAREPTPELQLHGRPVNDAFIAEYYRKKANVQSIDALLTPTRSRAPTPDGLCIRKRSQSPTEESTITLNIHRKSISPSIPLVEDSRSLTHALTRALDWVQNHTRDLCTTFPAHKDVGMSYQQYEVFSHTGQADKALQLLRLTFDNVQDALRKQSPWLVFELLLLHQYFTWNCDRSGGQRVRMLIHWAYQEASNLYGTSHPLCLLLSAVSGHTAPSSLQEFTHSLFDRVTSAYADSTSHITMANYIMAQIALYRHEYGEAEVRLKQVLSRLDSLTHVEWHFCSKDEGIDAMVSQHLAFVYLRLGKLDDAESLLLGIFTLPLPLSSLLDNIDILSSLLHWQRRHSEAASFCRRGLLSASRCKDPAISNMWKRRFTQQLEVIGKESLE